MLRLHFAVSKQAVKAADRFEDVGFATIGIRFSLRPTTAETHVNTVKLRAIAYRTRLLIVAALLTLLLGGRAVAADLVGKNPGDAMPVTIVSQKVSDDGKQCTVVLETSRGIFRLKIDGAAATFDKVTFIVRSQRSRPEGLSLETEKEAVELLHAKGVSVNIHERDCVIEFDAEGVKILKRGGRFQYIDAYR